MKILIDLDDTLADLQGRIEYLWSHAHDNTHLFPDGQRTQYFIGSGLSAEYASEIYHMMAGPGFFSSLEPIPGAIEAVHTMIERGHDVYLATSSGVSYPLAATEKYQWVEKHLGHYMLSRLIITNMKYLIQGDVLIDDRPEIYREDDASWEHVLFDQPYNKQQDKRRLNWENWQGVLEK